MRRRGTYRRDANGLREEAAQGEGEARKSSSSSAGGGGDGGGEGRADLPAEGGTAIPAYLHNDGSHDAVPLLLIRQVMRGAAHAMRVEKNTAMDFIAGEFYHFVT